MIHHIVPRCIFVVFLFAFSLFKFLSVGSCGLNVHLKVFALPMIQIFCAKFSAKYSDLYGNTRF